MVLLEAMGIRSSLGIKALEHPLVTIAVYNLDSSSHLHSNNHEQKVAVGSVLCVGAFSQSPAQREEMLSQGTVPLAC
jgi:hypothetical protein